VVRDRRGLPRLPRLVTLAPGFRLSQVSEPRRLARRRRAIQVRMLREEDRCDGWHFVRPAPNAAHGVVHGVLAVRDGEGRSLGAGLQRTLEFGSYQTAWGMLHRLRSVLVRPGRDRLSGTVEVDETYFGDEEPGLRGGRQGGKKVLASVAVEPRGFGRCRMAVLADASAASLEGFVTENVEEGSTLVTDAWSSYPPAVRDRYVHKPINVKRSGQPAHVVLPGVHRVASLAKRWFASTHRGRFDDAHFPNYLNEWVFRFNRRRSTSRGLLFYRLLELAVDHDPVRYRQLVANSKPKKVPPWRRGIPRPSTGPCGAPLEVGVLSRRSRLR